MLLLSIESIKVFTLELRGKWSFKKNDWKIWLNSGLKPSEFEHFFPHLYFCVFSRWLFFVVWIFELEKPTQFLRSEMNAIVGGIVRIKSSLGEEIQGEIFSYDATTNCLVLVHIQINYFYFSFTLLTRKHPLHVEEELSNLEDELCERYCLYWEIGNCRPCNGITFC